MASQSLYRKWRSQTFDQMVGQQEIVDTLKNALKTHTLRHAYLFTGPRGTGKTTTARLLAKTVNCTNSENGEPCNECQQCREIAAGNSFNVIEIDAASNRGIDSIRELREKVMVPPSTGKYKIYILDEAHMLTTEAFNALLKTLEEPPEYAIFVMATTDVHKMLPTVLSRCQQFNFKRISTRQIVNHVLFVSKEEGVEIERSAAELIARTAAGGMRDALSLLDQAIAYAGTTISLAQMQSMLGVADPRAISKWITHIARLESPALLHLIHELSEAGADLRQINNQLIEHWRALMLAKAGADATAILDLTEDEAKEVQQLVSAFTLEELTESARIFAQNELMQKNQATPQLGLELASLECIELHRKVQTGGSIARQNGATPISTQTQTSTPRVTMSTPPEVTSTPSRREEPASHLTQSAEKRHEEIPVEHKRPVESLPPLHESRTSPAGQGQTALTLEQIIASWESVKKRTKQKNRLLVAYLDHCQIISVEAEEEHTLVLIQPPSQRHFDYVRGNDRPKDIEWAFGTEFDRTFKVRLVAPGQTLQQTSQNLTSYSRTAIAPQSSAYRERPQPAEVAYLPEPPVAPTRPVALASESGSAYEISPPARQQEVRETKKVALSKAELGKKVEQDPVMQEFVKMFRGKIGDIEPK